MQSHTWYIELCIWDALGDFQPKALSSIIGSNSLRTQRIECLWKSVTAVKSYLDIVLSLPPLTWIGVSLLELTQVTKSFKTLMHLTTHGDTAWDKQAVRDICDPFHILDEVARIADEASSALGETDRDDLFRTLGSHTRSLREWARFNLDGTTVEVVSHSVDGASSAERGVGDESSSWSHLPPFFSDFTMPSYGFFGTGEWMERIFEDPY